MNEYPRASRLAAGGLVLAAVLLVTAEQIGGDDPAVAASLICLPTTAFALWILGRLGGPRPWPLLVAFAWGAVGAGTLAGSINDTLGTWSLSNVDPGLPLTWFSAGEAAFVEELLKAAVVAGLLLAGAVARPFGIRDCILLGAASGVGFNYSETAQLVASDLAGGSPVATFGDLFLRQVLDLLAGHAAYSALAGAGLGLALVLRPALRLPAIWCGLAGAMSAHFVWDAWGASLPSPDGIAGVAVQGVETVAVDGVSFTIALALLLAARSMRVIPAPAT